VPTGAATPSGGQPPFPGEPALPAILRGRIVTGSGLRERSGKSVDRAVRRVRIVRDTQVSSPPLITRMNRCVATDSNLSLDAESAIGDPGDMITQPYEIYLERMDTSKNMARYYAMDISATLFGQACLTRRWGRIGAHTDNPRCMRLPERRRQRCCSSNLSA